MMYIENLVMDEEILGVIDRVTELRRAAKGIWGFWDRIFFRGVTRDYHKLHEKINGLNVAIVRYNSSEATSGTEWNVIYESKDSILDEARELLVKIRKEIVDRHMEKRFGEEFMRKLGGYEKVVGDFHDYLRQEASKGNMPLSGMVRVNRIRNERGY